MSRKALEQAHDVPLFIGFARDDHREVVPADR